MVANVKGDESFPHFFHGNLGPNCVPLEGPFFEDKQEGTVVVFHEWVVLEVLNHRFKVQVLNSVFCLGSGTSQVVVSLVPRMVDQSRRDCQSDQS